MLMKMGNLRAFELYCWIILLLCCARYHNTCEANTTVLTWSYDVTSVLNSQYDITSSLNVFYSSTLDLSSELESQISSDTLSLVFETSEVPSSEISETVYVDETIVSLGEIELSSTVEGYASYASHTLSVDESTDYSNTPTVEPSQSCINYDVIRSTSDTDFSEHLSDASLDLSQGLVWCQSNSPIDLSQGLMIIPSIVPTLVAQGLMPSIAPTDISQGMLQSPSLVPTVISHAMLPSPSIVPTDISHSMLPSPSIVPTDISQSMLPSPSIVPTDISHSMLPSPSIVPTDISHSMLPSPSIVPTYISHSTLTSPLIVPTYISHSMLPSSSIVSTDISHAMLPSPSIVPTDISHSMLPSPPIVPTDISHSMLPSPSIVPTDISHSMVSSPPIVPTYISHGMLPSPSIVSTDISHSMLPSPPIVPTDISHSMLPSPSIVPTDISHAMLTSPSIVPTDISHSMLPSPPIVPTDISHAMLTSSSIVPTDISHSMVSSPLIVPTYISHGLLPSPSIVSHGMMQSQSTYISQGMTKIQSSVLADISHVLTSSLSLVATHISHELQLSQTTVPTDMYHGLTQSYSIASPYTSQDLTPSLSIVQTVSNYLTRSSSIAATYVSYGFGWSPSILQTYISQGLTPTPVPESAYDSDGLTATLAIESTQESEGIVGESESIDTRRASSTDGSLDTASEIDYSTSEVEYSTSLITEAPCTPDCSGTCNGEAVRDYCNVCSGGTTGLGANSTLDCLGICNGTSQLDPICSVCYGGNSTYATSSDIKDCNGVCTGNATVNACNHCAGGNTGKDTNFGIDRCGLCTDATNYQVTWDCNGDCGGNATWDICAQTCVGGNTGFVSTLFVDLIDCAGNCNGTAVNDTCDYCVNNATQAGFSLGSQFMDCTNTCFKPVDLGTSAMAVQTVDTCNRCVGGSSNLTSGKDACGVCSGNNSACSDCDGVPNGGKVLDACDVCGGDGTTCLAVASLSLTAIPADTTKTLTVDGAGFTRSNLQCVTRNSQGTDVVGTITSTQSATRIQCQLTLPVETYTVHVRVAGGPLSAANTTLVVYNVSAIVTISSTPENFTVGASVAFEFTGLGFSEVSPRYCVIQDTHSIVLKQPLLQEATVVNDTHVTCAAYTPAKSTSFSIHLSVNGIDPVSDTFTSTVYAPAPQVSHFNFLNTGYQLSLKFDRNIDTSSLTSCANIFENVTSLGSAAVCSWISLSELRVDIGQGNNLIVPTDSLTFMTDAIKVPGEQYPLMLSGSQVVSTSDTPPRVMAIITGPTSISECGSVELGGRTSQGGAGRSLTYAWTVTSTQSTTDIQPLINGDLVSISVNGSLMTINVDYIFTLHVTNFLNGTDSKSATIIRKNTQIPVAVIDSGVDLTQSVVTSNRFVLSGVGVLPPCLKTYGLLYEWSFSNGQVKTTTARRNRREYIVKPYDLPGDKTITVTLKVSFNGLASSFSTSSVTVQTVSSALIASIKGGPFRQVGVNSGTLTLDGSLSNDPVNMPDVMQYDWSCATNTGGTCISYKPDENGITFPTEAERNVSILSFDARRFQAGNTYVFTLKVIKTTRNSETTVSIQSLAGNPPKATIVSLPTTSEIKDSTVLAVKALIESTAAIQTVSWAMEQADGLGFLDLSVADNLNSVISFKKTSTTQYYSIVEIKTAKLFKDTTYKLLFTATDVDSGTGIAKSNTFFVPPDVTGCALNTPFNYTELSVIELSVTQCKLTYPASYTFFVVDAAASHTGLSDKLSIGQLSLLGPSPENSAASVKFSVKVCNSYEVCALFDSGSVSVTLLSSNGQVSVEVEDAVIAKADEFEKLGEYSNALRELSNLLRILQRSGGRRKRSAFVLNSGATVNLTDSILGLVKSALDNSNLDKEKLSLYLDRLANIPVSDLTVDGKNATLDYIKTILESFKLLTPKSNVDQTQMSSVFSLLDMLEASGFNRGSILVVRNALVSAASSQMPSFGATQEIKDANGKFVLQTIYRALDSAFNASHNGSDVTIDFGTQLLNRYANWDCGGTSNCNGAVIRSLTYGQSENPFSDDTNLNKVSSIVDITLLNPTTGAELTVTALTTPISIQFTVVSKDGYVFQCYFWTGTDWSDQGLTMEEVDSTTVNCKSVHLTAFVVGSVLAPTTAAPTTVSNRVPVAPPVDNTGAIVGGVIGGVLALVLIATVAFLLIRHHKLKNMRVSSTSEILNVQESRESVA